MERTDKKLYRSSTDRILGGVCGGIAEYLNVDPALIRLAWFFLTLIGGAGILAYILALIIIPLHPEGGAAAQSPPANRGDYTRLAGFMLIILGALFLIRQLGFHFNFFHLPWPVFLALGLIAFGVYMLLHASDKKTAGDEQDSEDERTFVRIENGKMIAGVCTGLARYFDVDVTLVRLLWVFATLSSAGIGFLAYIIAVIIFPIVSDLPEWHESREEEKA